jgi:hypothetical protein
MSEQKIATTGTTPKAGGGTPGGGGLCDPVITILKPGSEDKTLFPNPIAYVPMDPPCDGGSITWVLNSQPGNTVRYEILPSPVFDLTGIPLKGTLDHQQFLKIPLVTEDAGAGAVVFSGSDPVTSVVIID